MDVQELRNNLREDIRNGFDQANKLWFEFLRLIITLSSSFLLITLALVDKLFPKVHTLSSLSLYLIISWILFFFAIVFAMISKANEIIFFGNIARNKANKLRDVEDAIEKDEDLSVFKPTQAYINNSITWGIFTFNSFLLGILMLCLAFLENIIPAGICGRILLFCIILIIFVNIHLLKKRKT